MIAAGAMPDDFSGDDLEDGDLGLGELDERLPQPQRDVERGKEVAASDVRRDRLDEVYGGQISIFVVHDRVFPIHVRCHNAGSSWSRPCPYPPAAADQV
jgi:hypothetical protein